MTTLLGLYALAGLWAAIYSATICIDIRRAARVKRTLLGIAVFAVLSGLAWPGFLVALVALNGPDIFVDGFWRWAWDRLIDLNLSNSRLFRWVEVRAFGMDMGEVPEEPRDTYSDNLIPPCGFVGPIPDIPPTDKVPGFEAQLVFASKKKEQRDTWPTGFPVPSFEAVPASEVKLSEPVQCTLTLGKLDSGTHALRYKSDCGCTDVIGYLVVDGDGSVQAVTLKTELPPLDFDDLPDVTEDAVESAAKVLSERPPRGDVA